MKISRSKYHKLLETERITAIKSLQQVSRKLQSIENALTRLSDGCFGICTGCGEVISTERLMFLPYAELCLACQQNKEESI